MLYTDLGGNLGANKVKKNQAADQNRLWVYSEDWATSLSLFTFMHWRRKWQPTPVFLPGESQGWGTLVDSAAAATHFSRVWLCATLWAVAHQAPPSPGFSRQEHWSGVLCPPQGGLPDPGTEHVSLMSLVSAGRFLNLTDEFSWIWKLFCGKILYYLMFKQNHTHSKLHLDMLVLMYF